MLTKPSVATYKYTLDTTSADDSYQVATSSRELIAVVVTGGGGGIMVGIYDSANGGTDPKNALFIAANAGESTPFAPPMTIPFKNGIYVRVESGGDPFNGKVFLLMN